MAALPQKQCPTLAAADAALVAAQDGAKRRMYLGMSAIGRECARALWYGFRWVSVVTFDAETLKRFEDGHRTEELVLARLRAIPGIELHDIDESGEQFGFKDLGGHFSGHMDGVALGLVQAPQTWHVVEVKATEKLAALAKAMREYGEKLALRQWNAVYYAQAVLYMHYAELDRHYLVAASPGGRTWMAVRTDADPAEALALIQKAERIIFADEPPARIGQPSSLACQWCEFAQICHEGAPAERNCRTCLHVTPQREGGWLCAAFGHELSRADQEAGCISHRFLPGLVAGEQIDADEASVTYRMADGAIWTDRGPVS